MKQRIGGKTDSMPGNRCSFCSSSCSCSAAIGLSVIRKLPTCISTATPNTDADGLGDLQKPICIMPLVKSYKPYFHEYRVKLNLPKKILRVTHT